MKAQNWVEFKHLFYRYYWYRDQQERLPKDYLLKILDDIEEAKSMLSDLESWVLTDLELMESDQ